MKNENYSTPIHPYSKSELALLYFPGCNENTARNRMARWISRCQELTQKLKAGGYNPLSHWYTPREVRLIFDYLGEP